MENSIYSWLVKKGNIIIQRNRDCVSLRLECGNENDCLLTPTDTSELIDILTHISKQIWEDPNYVRKQYSKQGFQTHNHVYSWEILDTQFSVKYNQIEDAIEIKCIGTKSINLEINDVIEVIQILEHLNR